jgi:hypothetical protein
MMDSVFFSNAHTAAYTESNARGVTTAGGSNPAKNNVVGVVSPIQSITRANAVVRGGKTMLHVTSLNPLPLNDALVAAATAPNDGFYTPANYRGAFAPDHNWLQGWSAAEQFGLISTASNHPVLSETTKVEVMAGESIMWKSLFYNYSTGEMIEESALYGPHAIPVKMPVDTWVGVFTYNYDTANWQDALWMYRADWR